MAASVVILASVLSLLVWGVAGLSDGRIIFEDLDIGHIPRSIFEELEHEEKLSCEQKTYKAYIERKDEQGRKCWDNLLLPACWGRCDSFEVADWRFPYKLQKHPVCNFGSRVSASVRMRNCDKGTSPGTEVFSYLRPTSCVCKSCNRVDTNCGWLSDPTITENLISPPHLQI